MSAAPLRPLPSNPVLTFAGGAERGAAGTQECAPRRVRQYGMAGSHASLHTVYGIPFEVRPLTRDDRDRLAAAFARMSERSRRRRFLGPKPKLSRTELTYLTDIDHRTHDALAAIDPDDGAIVGVARYAAEPDLPGTAEIALFVVDAWQGQGIATTLGTRLVARADANGIARLTAVTFPDNRAARAVLLTLGFRTIGMGAGVLQLERVR
jgi:RimJ/RimL family protein N-acetyltransferase